MTENILLAFRNAAEIYEYLCRPICKSANILQGELEVLLFLANHPGMDTAADIHKCGGIKQSMLSTLIEKLVQGGYLERQSVPGDRRKVRLLCTEKAAAVIEAGLEVKRKMLRYMGEGISAQDGEAFDRVMTAMEQNILRCREKMLKGEME